MMRNRYSNDGYSILGVRKACGRVNDVQQHGTTAPCKCAPDPSVWREHGSILRPILSGPRTAIAITAALFASPSWGVDFEVGEGWKGNWTNSVTIGTAVRAHHQDSRLYGQANGALVGRTDGTGNNTIDEGELNYNKGDAFTTQIKWITELAVNKGEAGMLVRAKAWYDYALRNQNVHFGNTGNGYNGYNLTTNTLGAERPLSDRGFEQLSKFQGIYLLDAYVYNTFDVGGQALQVRAGNQVVNWGESLFIQGINQIAPIDVPSFRKPGVQLKEVFLPVPLLFASQSLGEYGSLEAFYQLQWKPTPIEAGCGNYWGVAGASISAIVSSCNNAVSIAGSSPFGYYNGGYVRQVDGEKGKNSGQFGLAYRFNSAALDTEFGIYAQMLNARIPNLNVHFGNFLGVTPPSGVPFAASWDYVNAIKMFGVSAATNLFGLSVGAELSHQNGVPAQVDGNDLLLASLGAGGALPGTGGASVPFGPYGSQAVAAKNGNGFLPGFTRTNKTQFNLNAVKAGSNLLGAGQYVLIGEVGLQWNNLPDYRTDPTAVRYGRNFIFGPGPSPLYGVPCAALNISVEGCQNDGYVTRFSWGYRTKFDLTYNNVLDSGVTVTPSVFFAHDVKGVSVDSQFLQSRRALGLSAKFSYAKNYTLELGYVTYNHNAKYDPLRDRDFFAATVGVYF